MARTTRIAAASTATGLYASAVLVARNAEGKDWRKIAVSSALLTALTWIAALG